MDITPDSKYLYIGDVNKDLTKFTIYPLGSFNEFILSKKSFKKIHGADIYSIKIDPDGVYIFTGAFNGTFRQWYIENGNLVKNYGPIFDLDVVCTAIMTDGKFLFVAGSNFDLQGQVKQLDIENRNIVQDYGCIEDDVIISLEISYDNQYLYVGFREKGIFLIDIYRMIVIRKFCGFNNFYKVLSIAIVSNHFEI